LPGVASPLSRYGRTLGRPALRQIGQIPKIGVLVEEVADVNCVVAHRAAVEELPSTILLVEDEQDR
jgi:hypothetical protein